MSGFLNVQPVTLWGTTVWLEPLTREHTPALHRHAEPEVFHWMLDWPEDAGYAAFEAWERRGEGIPASLRFAIRRTDTGEPVGSTAYLDIRTDHACLEVGRTWIGRAHQGTAVNPESKYLLLRHAFETLGAARVQLKTDLRNLHSQRAIAKLGAQREGVLRNYQRRADGTVRDTVMYAITDADWPAVKAGLEARLG
jgi:N-acetyltransferase